MYFKTRDYKVLMEELSGKKCHFTVLQKFLSKKPPVIWQFFIFNCISSEREKHHLPLQTRKGVNM